MMDDQDLRTVARPGSSSSEPDTPKRPSSAPWRTISLLATPLVLGMVNLVDAHFDKQNAITSGDAAYRRLVGEGEVANRISVEEGYSVGSKLQSGIVTEAANRAKGIVSGARGKAAQTVLQGDLEGELVEKMGKATIGMMEPLHLMSENLLEITRLALLDHEDIEIAINIKSLDDVRYVRRRSSTASERQEMGRLAMVEAPRFAKEAANARYRWDMSLTTRPPVCK